jgi:formate--tetrahydrofolate ligase
MDTKYKTDIQIANKANKKPIVEIAKQLHIPYEDLLPFGHDKAKVSGSFIKGLEKATDGHLILVTGVNPTPAGEGKTTLSIGLGDGLHRIGKKTAICIREASLGPCFGVKGGATGGGYAQVIPMEDMNLHFTGDFHAVTAAHNLLAAIIDNHIYWGNQQSIDTRRVSFRRVLDVNDRALRHLVCGLGGVTNGVTRETGFDITAASEIMAILCLAVDLDDLQNRLGKIIIGYRRDLTPVYCRDLNADGAMAVLLKQAIQPNLIQTLENTPVFVHGGPFANIAHGCSSVVATKTALKLADYVVTEAGFGADLGAEKFFHIKCQQANLKPAAAVIVTTVRAMKMHGGVTKTQLNAENVDAVTQGCSNLGRHMENIKKFGVPFVVAINHFTQDTEAEIQALQNYVSNQGGTAYICQPWEKGGAGTEALTKAMVHLIETHASNYQPLYAKEMGLFQKIETIAKHVYRADQVRATQKIREQLQLWETQGYGHLPVCIAKTPYSFTADQNHLGAPSGHILPIREVKLSAGAGFVVVICGDIMTMPGLPKTPAAESIRLDQNGFTEGLF